MSEQPVPRLRLATDDELADQFRTRTDSLTRVFGHNSALLARWNEWYRPLVRDMSLSARLKEIVRFRVAQLNACDY